MNQNEDKYFEPVDLLGQARNMRVKVEEEIQKEIREQAKTSALGLLLTFVGFFFLGLMLFIFYAVIFTSARIPEKSITLFEFFLIYTAIVTILMVVSLHYKPKDDYNLGISRGRGYMDNPFTHKDNLERAHMALGFLLVIPNFIRMNVKTLVNYLTHKNPIQNTTIAGIILLIARNHPPVEEFLPFIRSFGFGEKITKSTLFFLQLVKWIDVREKEDESIISPTDKGEEILSRATNYGKASP